MEMDGHFNGMEDMEKRMRQELAAIQTDEFEQYNGVVN